jgi:hypothetical protein
MVACYMLHHIIQLHLIILIISGEVYKFLSLSLHSFLQPSVTSRLKSKYPILLTTLMHRPQRNMQNGTTNNVCKI